MSQNKKHDLVLISYVVVLGICVIGLMYSFTVLFYSAGILGTTQVVEETNSSGIENVTITPQNIIIEPEESDNLRTVYVLGEDTVEQNKKKLSPDQSEIKFKYYRASGLYPFNDKYTYNIVVQDEKKISHKQITTQNGLF